MFVKETNMTNPTKVLNISSATAQLVADLLKTLTIL